MGGEQPGRVRPFLARRLADSPELRSKVEAAYHLGISVKRLDGWEPVTVSEHEYDDAGRLLRTVTRREPEWDDEQRAWMDAWLLYKSGVHEACGHYLPDSTATEAEDGYVAELPIRCHACTARARAFTRYSESQHVEALLFPVKRKDG